MTMRMEFSMEKYRYRKKEDKIQVQKLEGDKWISRTLPDAEVTFNWLCPAIVSSPTHKQEVKKEDKPIEKCVQSPLNVLSEEDTESEIIEGITDDETKAKAKEALRKLGL